MTAQLLSARAVPLDEQEPITADWRRIVEPTRNWYYPGSDTELNLGAAQVVMHDDALHYRRTFREISRQTEENLQGFEPLWVADLCAFRVPNHIVASLGLGDSVPKS